MFMPNSRTKDLAKDPYFVAVACWFTRWYWIYWGSLCLVIGCSFTILLLLLFNVKTQFLPGWGSVNLVFLVVNWISWNRARRWAFRGMYCIFQTQFSSPERSDDGGPQ